MTTSEARAGRNEELLDALKRRFEANMVRHPGVAWDDVVARLEAHPERLAALGRMEATGGEPDVTGRDEARTAIANMARAMLEPPIRNLGVAGIRKAASEIPRWPSFADGGGLQEALFNLRVFVSEVGGSGGGCFRFMLSRFLREAHAMGCGRELGSVADAFEAIAEDWDRIGATCLAASESTVPDDALAGVGAAFAAVADLEDAAWRAAMAAAREDPGA